MKSVEEMTEDLIHLLDTKVEILGDQGVEVANGVLTIGQVYHPDVPEEYLMILKDGENQLDFEIVGIPLTNILSVQPPYIFVDADAWVFGLSQDSMMEV